MDFEEWKKKASYEARRLAGITDLLGEEDPYSIEDDMENAYEEDVDPEDFIREAFGDEIADYEEEGPAEDGGDDFDGGDDDDEPLDDEGGDDEFEDGEEA